MPLPLAFGIDPDETWEVDFVREEGRYTLTLLREQIATRRADAAKEPDPEKRKTVDAAIVSAEGKAATLEAELAAYDGSGPIFTVGPIPNGKRAEIQGDSLEVIRLPEGKDRLVRDRAWAESVVRWAVRDHRNLRSGKSKRPIPFQAEEVDFAGGKRKVVSRKTLEAYAPILGDLALLVLRSQQLDEAGKNA